MFVSVEHPRNGAIEGGSLDSVSDSVTVGDIYASVADGEVLFQVYIYTIYSYIHSISIRIHFIYI